MMLHTTNAPRLPPSHPSTRARDRVPASRMLHAATVLVALLALVPFVLATPHGLGISADSTQYLATARNLVNGNGLLTVWWSGRAEALTHFPPLYPLTLALLGAGGMSVERAAWLLQLVLLPANVLLVASLAARISGGTSHERALVAAATATTVAIATDVLSVHTMMYSEPLFLTLFLLSCDLIASSTAHVRDGRAGRARAQLALAAALASLAVLTRYVGIVLIGTTIVLILGQQIRSRRSRIVRALVYGVVALAPLLCWSAFNQLRGLNASDREMALHVISRASVIDGVATVSHWFSPYAPWTLLRAGALLVTALGGAILVAVVVRSGPRVLLRTSMRTDASGSDGTRQPDGVLAMLFALFVACYGAFLLLSISIADRSTDLDERILFVALPPVLALLVAFIARVVRHADAGSSPVRRRLVRVAAGLLLAGYSAGHLLGEVAWARDARLHGLALDAVARAAPQLIDEVRALPTSARIYSNMPYEIYFATGRTVIGMPRRQSPTSLVTNVRMQEELAAMSDSLGVRTYLVYFDAGLSQTFLATHDDVARFVAVAEGATVPGGHIDEVLRHAPQSAGATRAPVQHGN
jgi:hypothetical protein